MKRTLGALLALILIGGCASVTDPDQRSADPTTVISHETTGDISVWVPEGNGPWQMVYALHGLGGHRDDLAELAAILADQGILVFSAQHSAPDCSTAPKGSTTFASTEHRALM